MRAPPALDISLKNPTASRLEAELLVPVPEGVAIRGFDFEGSGKEPSAELLPKHKAKATYKTIVAKIKDPALLEFAGYNLVRSSGAPWGQTRLSGVRRLSQTADRCDWVKANGGLAVGALFFRTAADGSDVAGVYKVAGFSSNEPGITGSDPTANAQETDLVCAVTRQVSAHVLSCKQKGRTS